MGVNQLWLYQSRTILKSIFPFSINSIGLFSSLISVIFLLNSCGTAFYGPALQGSDISYQPKPMMADSLKSNTYLKAVFGSGSTNNFNDSKQFFEINYSKAHVFKNFNTSYGGFLCLGEYSNGYLEPSDPYYFGSKGFGVYGFRASANVVSVSGRTEYRFPGIELSMSKEFGSYAAFRRQVLSTPGFYVNINTFLTTVSGTAEIIWHQKQKVQNQYGIRLLLGRTLGNDTMTGFEGSIDAPEKNMIFSFAYFFKFNQLGLSIESSLGTSKFGLVYSFK